MGVIKQLGFRNGALRYGLTCRRARLLPMEEEGVHITETEIKNQLRSTKNNTAPDPDSIKPDLFKIL